MGERLGVAQQNVSRTRERRRIDGLVTQRRLRFGIAPGLVGHAADGQPCLADAPARQLQPDRDGHQRNVIDTMQTREELYDRIGYHAYERHLDELFSKKV